MGSNPPSPPGQGPIPEVLPPATSTNGHPGYYRDGYTVVPPPPVARPRRRWATAPATWTLLAINCAVYVLMVITGTNPIKPSSESLLLWGADNAGAVLVYGDWWRIVAAMFIHGGFLHLALNMWCLWNLGMLAEPLMGTFGVFAVYLLTGASGNLLSICYNWFAYHNRDAGAGLVGPVGVGASGAIFGIAGALIVLLKSNRLPVPPDELKKLRRSVIYFAAINLVIGFSIHQRHRRGSRCGQHGARGWIRMRTAIRGAHGAANRHAPQHLQSALAHCNWNSSRRAGAFQFLSRTTPAALTARPMLPSVQQYLA
jgi:rhomboid protease GluP